MSAAPLPMLGVVDPGGASLGPLIPLFAGAGVNAPLVQLVDARGLVSGFEPFEAPDAPLLPARSVAARLGGRAVMAFGFGKGDVEVFGGEDGPEAPIGRLDGRELRDRPLVALELAGMLGLGEERLRLARKVHAAMRVSSPDVADRWLDLGVLTTDLRRTLRARGDSTGDLLAKVVVARVRPGTLEALGIDEELSPRQEEGLRGAALETLEALRALYPPPPSGWRVHVAGAKRPHEWLKPDAAVLLDDALARSFSFRQLPDVPRLDVFQEPSVAFTRMVEETDVPIFVVHLADDDTAAGRVGGGWSGREVVGIAFGAPRRPGSPLAVPWRTIRVPTTGIGRSPEAAVATATRLAVAVELDRRADDRPFSRDAVLLRSSLGGAGAEGDAWAALYDRAWGLGLAPWRALLIPGRNNTPSADHPTQDWVSHALFQEGSFAEGGFTAAVMDGTRIAAAALVDASDRTREDLVRHRWSVTRLLERQGWGIRDQDFRDAEAELVIEGASGSYRVGLAAHAHPSPEPAGAGLFDLDLDRITRLAVAGPASPGAVLRTLVGSRELLVGARDLLGFDAGEGTILTLLGAQLRRMVTRLPSRSRTMLIALVAAQAFKRGGRDAWEVNGLLSVLESPALGEELHLALRSVRAVEDAVETSVVVLDRAIDVPGRMERRRGWREVAGFEMRVASQDVGVRGLRSLDHEA